MKRAALYVRVSTQEQKNSGLSVDSQIDALEKYCEEQGYTVAGIIVQMVTSTEISPTLTTAWYSYWTVEIVALAGIKITNVIKGEKDTDVYDNSNRKD